MRLPYRLRAPRGNAKYWYLRCTHNSLRLEISTKHTVEAVAWAFAAELYETLLNDPAMNAEDPLAPEVSPEPVRLGPFETYLMTNFVLLGERIIRLGDNKSIAFYMSAHGYRQAQVKWERRVKRVLEHRWKFLLHHRWLPRSIDHVNGIRHDNTLANLRASTPYLQAQNRGMPRETAPKSEPE